MLRLIDRRNLGVGDQRLTGDLPRPNISGGEPVTAVRDILADVRARGDAALIDLTKRLDGVELTRLRVTSQEISAALARVTKAQINAMRLAADNVLRYHQEMLHEPVARSRQGMQLRELVRPVRRAGLYVPGGRAKYPSTVIMTAQVARAAGVGEIVLCVPPGANGLPPDETLAAAAICEVDEIYSIGGAQAVGAMAYGTDSMRAVDVIVGPGNIYVSIAKREVAAQGAVGVPSAFAGPSEVVVIADETTPALWSATDIAVQAEHGPHGLAWLITWSESYAQAVLDELSTLVGVSSREAEISSTLRDSGVCVLVDGPAEAIAVSNSIGPEHLELLVENPEALFDLVECAGAVFAGKYSPAALGDYVAGPSHVLPTFGSARYAGALRVDDFLREIHVVQASAQTIEVLGPSLVELALAEGLETHADAVRVRQYKAQEVS